MTLGLLSATINQAAFVVPVVPPPENITRVTSGLLLRDTFTRADAGSIGEPEYDKLSLSENWVTVHGAMPYNISNFRLEFPANIPTNPYILMHSASYDASSGWVQGANILASSRVIGVISKRFATSTDDEEAMFMQTRDISNEHVTFRFRPGDTFEWNANSGVIPFGDWRAYRMIQFEQTSSLGGIALVSPTLATGSIVADFDSPEFESRQEGTSSISDFQLVGPRALDSNIGEITYYKDYYLCERNIAVSGLPTGYKTVLINISGSITQSESGGAVVINIDKFGLPATELQILDSGDQLILSYTNDDGQPDDGIWGGDIFEVS